MYGSSYCDQPSDRGQLKTLCEAVEACVSVLQVAAEVAAPLSQTKKVTMVSMGKGDVGAAKLTTEVLDVVERIPNVVEGLTGVNITKVILVHFWIP